MDEDENKERKWFEKITWMHVIILVIFLIITLMLVVRVVPAGHVGVYDLFGEVREVELMPGIYLKHPLAHIEKMSIKTQEYTMSSKTKEGKVSGDDSVSALTKEGLTVGLDITILYKMNPKQADEIYKEIGIKYVDVIIRPQVKSIIREGIAKYEAKSVYSESRSEVESYIYEELKNRIGPRGIIVERVLLRDVRLPSKISEAIQLKLAAEQQIEQKEFEVRIETQEAERKRVEAHGIADANEIIATSLTKEYLTWYWIESLEKHESVIYVPIGESGLPIFKEIG